MQPSWAVQLRRRGGGDPSGAGENSWRSISGWSGKHSLSGVRAGLYIPGGAVRAEVTGGDGDGWGKRWRDTWTDGLGRVVTLDAVASCMVWRAV